MLAIRRGPWKLIPIQNGGGIREDPDAHDPDEPDGQLYNLEVDLSETNNVYSQRRDVVANLTVLLEHLQRKGRSRPRERVEKP